MANRYDGYSRINLFNALKNLKNKGELTPSAYNELDEAFQATESKWSKAQKDEALKDRSKRESLFEPEFITALNELRGVKQAPVQSRMAGDDLSQALTDDDVIDFLIEMEGPDSATSALPDAYQILMDKTNEYARLNKQLVEAGVRPNDIDMYKELDTGTLVGGSPGPYIKSKKGLQTRVFMDRENNSITGNQELVPFIDKSTDKPLTFTFGYQPNIYDKYNMANEAVQLAALKLTNKKSRMNPNNRRRGSDGRLMYHHADFQQEGDGKTNNVEGMIRRADGDFKSSVAIPSFTQIIPQIPARGNFVTDKVRNIVKDEIRKENIGAIQAVNRLLDKGDLGVSESQYRDGKLNRADRSKYGNEAYDELIFTGYDSKDMSDYNYTQDQVALPPESVHLAPNLNKVKEYVERNNPRFFTGKDNFGKTGSGQARSKIQHSIALNAKLDGNRIFEDMAEKYPAVAQILKLNEKSYQKGKTPGY